MKTRPEDQASRMLLTATKRAKAKLGAAWDNLPHLRDPYTAIELLALMAAKDPEDATETTALILISAADSFTQQTVK